MNEHLEAELRGVAGALDRLGEADRASMGAGFVERLAGELWPGASEGRVARGLDALGRSERAAAPEGFEDRVVERVGEVFEPAPIRIGARRRVVLGVGMAAAVALAGVGAWIGVRSAAWRGGATVVAGSGAAGLGVEEELEVLLELYEEPSWTVRVAEFESEAEEAHGRVGEAWDVLELLSGADGGGSI